MRLETPLSPARPQRHHSRPRRCDAVGDQPGPLARPHRLRWHTAKSGALARRRPVLARAASSAGPDRALPFANALYRLRPVLEGQSRGSAPLEHSLLDSSSRVVPPEQAGGREKKLLSLPRGSLPEKGGRPAEGLEIAVFLPSVSGVQCFRLLGQSSMTIGAASWSSPAPTFRPGRARQHSVLTSSVDRPVFVAFCRTAFMRAVGLIVPLGDNTAAGPPRGAQSALAASLLGAPRLYWTTLARQAVTDSDG